MFKKNINLIKIGKILINAWLKHRNQNFCKKLIL